MQVRRLDLHAALPPSRHPDAEERDAPSGTGVVLGVLVPLVVWAFLAALGATL